MKYLLFFAVLFSGFSSIAQSFGSLYDDRDGKTYKTVTIGNQIWMAENLAFRPGSGNFFIYNNDVNNVSKYGYLYDWATACKVCPTGWKLPSNAEFLEMTNLLGQNFKQKMMLKTAWAVEENAIASSGFSGLPSGMRDHTGAFKYLGAGGYYWTATFSHQSFAFAREIGKNAGNWASHEFGTNQYIGMSVRCMKDNSFEEENEENLEPMADEYSEEAYEEPAKNVYPENHSIKKGVTEYIVSKTQTCNETQDLYYEYTGDFKCDPVIAESFKFTVDIHLDDPMYNEAKITMVEQKTKEVTEIDIEYVEELEDGSLNFVFSISNQPHQFILNKTKKTLLWYSEWGHWKVSYFYQ